MMAITAMDGSGNAVRIGDLVRIVALDMHVFSCLEPSEVEDIRSMIGQSFPVEKISATGLVTVTKSFQRGQGMHEFHTLTLLREQFELVDQAPDR